MVAEEYRKDYTFKIDLKTGQLEDIFSQGENITRSPGLSEDVLAMFMSGADLVELHPGESAKSTYRKALDRACFETKALRILLYRLGHQSQLYRITPIEKE